MVYIHHFLWFCLVMAGLKSFLYGVADILGTTGAALYERQRALVNLKVLTPVAGRGPGSGVPLTPYNVAAVAISVLATDNLTEVDDRVVDLINAPPRLARNERGRAIWGRAGSPTFCTAVGAVLAGTALPWPIKLKKPIYAIRVTRCWRGALLENPEEEENFADYLVEKVGKRFSPIIVEADIRAATLAHLLTFTQGAFSQAAAEEDDE